MTLFINKIRNVCERERKSHNRVISRFCISLTVLLYQRQSELSSRIVCVPPCIRQVCSAVVRVNSKISHSKTCRSSPKWNENFVEIVVCMIHIFLDESLTYFLLAARFRHISSISTPGITNARRKPFNRLQSTLFNCAGFWLHNKTHARVIFALKFAIYFLLQRFFFFVRCTLIVILTDLETKMLCLPITLIDYGAMI